MFLKVSPVYWKIFGVLFTSIAAPLGIRQLDDGGKAGSTVEYIYSEPSPAASQELIPATTRVVAQGSGSTPEAAFQSALEAAMQQAIAAEVSAVEWDRHGAVYLASLRRNGKGVIRSWRELSSTSERHLTGRVFRSEIAVEIDSETLSERLHPNLHAKSSDADKQGGP